MGHVVLPAADRHSPLPAVQPGQLRHVRRPGRAHPAHSAQRFHHDQNPLSPGEADETEGQQDQVTDRNSQWN